MKVAILGCAVCAPGLPDWATAAKVLSGRTSYDRSAVRDPSPVALPPNERRRLPATARAALGVGIEALHDARIDDMESVATVFTSCGSDGEITHQICDGLARVPPEISPTRFHNSVHNAPGGYWSIALSSHAPSTSLCAFEGSFAAGLVEAAAQALAESCTVLLVAYDLPYPAPLSSLWNVTMPFSVALVLEPRNEGSHHEIEIAIAAERTEAHWPAGLPSELRMNPAAASLPLLALLANGEAGQVVLPYHANNSVVVSMVPS
jgi:Beta-ketoacyl synthase, N-terminal domain